MNTLQKISVFLLIGGLLLFIIGIIAGEAKVGFFLIFPFIISSGIYPIIGIFLIIISMLLYVFSVNFGYKEEFNLERSNIADKKVKYGGFILIGPIPIVIGSNWKITITMIILAVIIIIMSVILLRYF